MSTTACAGTLKSNGLFAISARCSRAWTRRAIGSDCIFKRATARTIRQDCPGRLRPRPLVKNHPVNAESIAQLAESGREERLLNRHEYLAAVLEGREDAFRVRVAVDVERQVCAAHRLRARDVGAHQV